MTMPQPTDNTPREIGEFADAVTEEPPRVKMIVVVLDGGFTVTVNSKAADDWALIELIDEAEENPARIVRLVRHLVGDTQYEALKSHYRLPDGRIDPETMAAVIGKILERLNPKS